MSRRIAPVAGIATADDVSQALAALANVPETLRADQRETLIEVRARIAAIAIAAGDVAAARRFVDGAALAALDASPDEFRALHHGRFRMERGDEEGAREVWTGLKKHGRSEAVRRAAADELGAELPMTKAPTLFTFNGFGAGLYGHRDPGPNGTYIATHCLCFLFVPVIPIGAYRVQAAGADSYYFLSRVPLSGFARIARAAVVAAVVLGAAVAGLLAYLHDPHAAAKQRLDGAIAHGERDDRETALADLDAALAAGDLSNVGDRAERAGAAIVRLSAAYVPAPFSRNAVDQAHKVALRYQSLPDAAQGGVARVEIVTALEGWTAALGTPDDLEARMILLRDGTAIDDASFGERLAATRRELATSLADEYPLEALAVMVDEPRDPALIALATPIMQDLVGAPSLLADAGADVDAWQAAAEFDVNVKTARERGVAGQTEAEAEGVTRAQLVQMQVERPWDQRVALALAQQDLADGKPEVAEQRLRELGPPGRLVRDVRYVLAQLAMSDGRLDDADGLLSRLLRTRLPQFVAAGAALDAAGADATARVELRLRTDNIPADLRRKLDGADDQTQQEVINEWGAAEIDRDPKVLAARDTYAAYSDVVRFSLLAATVKLQRAQGLDGAARDAMLGEAERMFLSIRTEAEGEPGFHLGLGEVYARLGKTEESEAQLQGLLERNDDDLAMAVAGVYRALGSNERATAVATTVFDRGDKVHKSEAAVLLALLATTDEDSAAWYRKADSADPYVEVSLLEIDGRRAMRQGKHAECDRVFAKAAKAHLTMGRGSSANNAALAHQQRFFCTGDLHALADAEKALERAYRETPGSALVVGNLAALLDSDAELRVLGRRIDLAALRPDGRDVDAILGALLAGSERDAVLAELATDAGARRAVELTAQERVLAPNSTGSYERELAVASRRRDQTAMRTALEHLRAARNLDTSASAGMRARWQAGEYDPEVREAAIGRLARAEEILGARNVSEHTRAAAHLIASVARSDRGIVDADADEMAKASIDALTAADLWPALNVASMVEASLIDEAGLRADAERWHQGRRVRSSIALVAKLAADGDRVVDAVRASSQWKELLPIATADLSRPGPGDLRLARLLGDATLIERASVVLDDEIFQLRLEAEQILEPDNETIAEDRALLARP